MNEHAFNLSIRKFLRHFGVTAQWEIEQAVDRGLANGTLRGDERLSVRAMLVLDGLVSEFRIEGELTLDRRRRASDLLSPPAMQTTPGAVSGVTARSERAAGALPRANRP